MEGLAKIINFDSKDYRKWLMTTTTRGKMPATPGEVVPDCEYSIPNTVFLDIGQSQDWDWVPISGYKIVVARAQQDANFRCNDPSNIGGYGKLLIVTYNANGNDTVQLHLQSPNLDSYIFGGHGSGGGMIGVDRNGNNELSPGRFTKYGISYMGLYACKSATDSSGKLGLNGKPMPNPWKWTSWEKNVSTWKGSDRRKVRLWLYIGLGPGQHRAHATAVAN